MQAVRLGSSVSLRLRLPSRFSPHKVCASKNHPGCADFLDLGIRRDVRVCIHGFCDFQFATAIKMGMYMRRVVFGVLWLTSIELFKVLV